MDIRLMVQELIARHWALSEGYAAEAERSKARHAAKPDEWVHTQFWYYNGQAYAHSLAAQNFESVLYFLEHPDWK